MAQGEMKNLSLKREKKDGQEKERKRWQRGKRFNRGERAMSKKRKKNLKEQWQLGAIFNTKRERNMADGIK